MAEKASELSFREKVLLLVGTVLGGVVTGCLITQLPIAQTGITSSVLLASLVLVCASASRRTVWWVGVGAIANSIIALGGVMAEYLAGLLAGIILGRRLPRANLPTLQDVLEDLGGLTVGLF